MSLVQKKNYDVYNSVYKCMDDAHEFPNTNLVRLQKWFLENNVPKILLDYGFGYAENSIFLAKKGYKVYAGEISKDAISFAKKKIKQKSIKRNINFFHISDKTKKLPFKNNFFGSIVCLGVIQYLGSKKKTNNLLKEFYRCLKPDGKFIISTFGPENTFIKNSKKISKNIYEFNGKEKFHNDIDLSYRYYIPYNANNFKSFFPSKLKVEEIGSWNNVYSGINGFHFVALGKKVV